MKLNKILTLAVLGGVLAITGVGCQIKTQRTTPIQDTKHHMMDPGIDPGLGHGQDLNPPSQITETPGNPQGGTLSTAIPPGSGHPGWGEDRTTLAPQTVYFALDKSAIRASEQPKLDEVAGYLKSNGSAAIRIEGNCDERGTEEYNRSLGDKRAMSAREYLAHLGIDSGRIDTLSNGEDKPAVHGHSEKAWSKNRRDEFIILNPPKP